MPEHAESKVGRKVSVRMSGVVDVPESVAEGLLRMTNIEIVQFVDEAENRSYKVRVPVRWSLSDGKRGHSDWPPNTMPDSHRGPIA